MGRDFPIPDVSRSKLSEKKRIRLTDEDRDRSVPRSDSRTSAPRDFGTRADLFPFPHRYPACPTLQCDPLAYNKDHPIRKEN